MVVPAPFRSDAAVVVAPVRGPVLVVRGTRASGGRLGQGVAAAEHEAAQQRPQQDDGDDQVDDLGQGRAPQPADLAVAELEGPPQLLLGPGAEDDGDDRRHHREAVAAHGEAEQADDEQDHQVDGAGVDRVGAERGEEQDAGVQVGPRGAQQPGPERGQRQVEDQQQRVADEQAGDQRPDEVALALEQQRARAGCRSW